MAEQDWTFLLDGLDDSVVKRAITAGVNSPPGGGDFVYAFNSLSNVKGAVGLHVNLDGFNPLPSGGSISACIKRGPSAGATGSSVFLFLGLGGTSVNDTAYLLGLSDEDPGRLVLRKGSLAVGIPDSDGPGALLASDERFENEWVHIKLEAVCNDNGDVVLNVAQNDLDSHPLGTDPVWEPLAGMSRFIDDAAHINTNSAPLMSGRAGFGFASSAVTQRGYVDHVQIFKQV